MTDNSNTYNPQLLKPTILTCGYTGSGKTSLIQGIFGNKTVPDCEISHSTPMTKDFVKYRNEFINIWDSRGFEASDDVKTFLQNQLERVIQLQNTKDIDNQIHVVWYTIQVSGGRVTEVDLYLIESIFTKVKNGIVVLTKTDQCSLKQLTEITELLCNKGIDRENICPVFVYQEKNNNSSDIDETDRFDTFEIRKQKINYFVQKVRELRDKLGEKNDIDDFDEVDDVDKQIDKLRNLRQKLEKLKEKEKSRELLFQLLNRTRTLMPKAYIEALMDAQMLDLEAKKAKAQAVIHSSALSASFVATDPIPLQDSVFITGIQFAMIASLAAVYGLSRESVKVAASPLLAQVVGPVAVTSLIKFVPILGSIAQFVVAGTLTEAVGQAVNSYFIKCCHAIINNEPPPSFILEDYQEFFKNLGNSEQ